MKIGVDARLLSRNITGIGRYTIEMCRALSKIDDVSLYLYSPSEIPNDIMKILPTGIFRIKKYKGAIWRQFWSETYLPYWAKKDRIDIFWGPSHRLPYFLPSTIPQAVTIHDLVWKYHSKTMAFTTLLLDRLQMPLALKQADHIIAASHSTAQDILKEFNVDKNRLSVVTLGSNHLQKAPESNQLQSIGISSPYCLFVGTMEPRKNLKNLLKAYSLLPDDVKNNHCLIIVGGKGWGGIDVHETINNLKLSSCVKVLGYVNETILTQLYKYAQFLAFPSLYEGFGLPIVEAMSYGIPILTSNNSSMKEIAETIGVLVEPLDVNSIKSALLTLILNKDLRNELSRKTKQERGKYNWDIAGQKLFNIFEQTINYKSSTHENTSHL